jgi:hypothetical protein
MRKQTSVATTAFLVACLSAALEDTALAQTNTGNARTQPGYGSALPNAKDVSQLQAQPASADEEGAPEHWMPVLIVTGVEVLRSNVGQPLDIVRAHGLTSTDGWASPQLVPLTRGMPPDRILHLVLVATAPAEAVEPTGFSPVDAIFVLEPDQPYQGIRVHGATNSVSLSKLPGSAEAAPARDDCAKCVGKYFVAKGAAVPSGKTAAEVVRETDLPATLRVIKASEGIGTLDSDPNRLNLLLDDDGRIEMAIWD